MRTKVPFVLPRSSTTTPSPRTVKRAWRGETVTSSGSRSTPSSRPQTLSMSSRGKAGPAAPSVRVVVRRRPRRVVLLWEPFCAISKPHWAQKRNPVLTAAPQRPQVGSAGFSALEGKGSGCPQSRQKRRLGCVSRPQRSHLTGFAIPIISPCVYSPVNATTHVVGR